MCGIIKFKITRKSYISTKKLQLIWPLLTGSFPNYNIIFWIMNDGYLLGCRISDESFLFIVIYFVTKISHKNNAWLTIVWSISARRYHSAKVLKLQHHINETNLFIEVFGFHTRELRRKFECELYKYKSELQYEIKYICIHIGIFSFLRTENECQKIKKENGWWRHSALSSFVVISWREEVKDTTYY